MTSSPHPDLAREDIRACLAFAAELTKQRVLHPEVQAATSIRFPSHGE